MQIDDEGRIKHSLPLDLTEQPDIRSPFNMKRVRVPYTEYTGLASLENDPPQPFIGPLPAPAGSEAKSEEAKVVSQAQAPDPNAAASEVGSSDIGEDIHKRDVQAVEAATNTALENSPSEAEYMGEFILNSPPIDNGGKDGGEGDYRLNYRRRYGRREAGASPLEDEKSRAEMRKADERGFRNAVEMRRWLLEQDG